MRNLFPGLPGTPTIQIVTFSDTNYGRGSFEGTFTTEVSFVLPLLAKIHAKIKKCI